jgi:hypothetical protein
MEKVKTSMTSGSDVVTVRGDRDRANITASGITPERNARAPIEEIHVPAIIASRYIRAVGGDRDRINPTASIVAPEGSVPILGEEVNAAAVTSSDVVAISRNRN